MRKPTPEIVVRGQSSPQWRQKWQSAHPAAKAVTVVVPGGFLLTGFLFAVGQFLQTRGVQSVLTSRIFLILALVFALVSVIGIAWAFFYPRRHVITILAVLVLGTCGYFLDRAFPMPSTQSQAKEKPKPSEKIAEKLTDAPEKQHVPVMPKSRRSSQSRPAPTIEQIRLIQTREIPSTLPQAPYGLEMMFQTTVPLQPFEVTLECASPVAHVEISPTANFTGFIDSTISPNWRAEEPRWRQESTIARARLNSPAFTPASALIVNLFSKTPNHCDKVSYKAGHPQ